MNRRTFLGTVAGGLLAAPLAAEGQQPYRIGVLSSAKLDLVDPLLDTFRKGMHDLGYTESQVVFHVRTGKGQAEDDLSGLVGELVRLNVDVILVASSTPAALAAKRATTKIPIVAVAVGEPVRTGLVPNIARPGPRSWEQRLLPSVYNSPKSFDQPPRRSHCSRIPTTLPLCS